MPENQPAASSSRVRAASVWVQTHTAAGRLQARLARIYGRPVTLREVWHVAVDRLARLTDEDLRQEVNRRDR